MVAYDTGCIGAMGWFTGMCHGVARLDRGDRIDMWGRAMGTQVTGWIGAMGLNHGDMWQWLDRGNGIISWGHATLAGAGQWDWFMGVCRGACNTGWIGAMGLIYVMGAHDWIGEMGLIWGGTPLGCDTGWDTSWGRDWIREMGLICGGMPWGGGGGGGGGAILAGCELWDWFIGVFHGGRNWIGAMELICGGEPWGRAWHWLDLGEGIDLCGRVMRVYDTGWIGAMGLIHGRVSNGKVLYGCWM